MDKKILTALGGIATTNLSRESTDMALALLSTEPKQEKRDPRKYPKVYRLDNQKRDNPFPLDEPVIIQEKLDGSNVSIEILKDEIVLYSRMKKLNPEDKTDKKNWSPLFKWAEENKERQRQMFDMADVKDLQSIVVHGEWLMMAKLPYNNTHKNTFHVFDIKVNDKFMNIEDMIRIAERYFNVVPVIGHADSLQDLFPKIESLVEGQKTLLEHSDSRREGIVVKTIDGQHRVKFVSDEFKESMGAKKDKKIPLFTINRELIGSERVQKYIYRLKEKGIVDAYVDFSDGQTIGQLFKNQKDLIDDFMEEEFEGFLKLVKKEVGKQAGNAIKVYMEKQKKLQMEEVMND